MLALTDFLDVSIRYYLHNQLCINTFHFQPVEPLVELTEYEAAQDLALAYATEIFPPFLAVQSEECLGHIVRAQVVRPNGTGTPSRFLFRDEPLGGQVGLVEGSSLPSGNAVVLRRRTMSSTRHGRGRVYIAGIPSGWEEDSRISPLNMSSYTGLAQYLAVDIDGASGQTYRSVLVDRPTYVNPLRVIATQADDIIRYQRRREVGVGQ